MEWHNYTIPRSPAHQWVFPSLLRIKLQVPMVNVVGAWLHSIASWLVNSYYSCSLQLFRHSTNTVYRHLLPTATASLDKMVVTSIFFLTNSFGVACSTISFSSFVWRATSFSDLEDSLATIDLLKLIEGRQRSEDLSTPAIFVLIPANSTHFWSRVTIVS